MIDDYITLPEGSGGKEMNNLIASFGFELRGLWKNCDDDAATLDLGDGRVLVFTSDSYTITPIFFPGGNIGDLAFAGTVNDLCVMGATPLGLSLSLVIEEGFSKKELNQIITTIKNLSKKYNIPIVTGDTKVMESGKIDKIVINTSGVGITRKEEILNKKIEKNDVAILSGGIGEHAVALLSKRFDYQTSIITDSKPLVQELKEIRYLIKIAKDPTRGGIASTLNEIAEKNRIIIELDESKIPIKPEVKKVAEMLGINVYELASEGRFICIAKKENSQKIIDILKKYNKEAAIIGRVMEIKQKEPKVIIQTYLGQRILPIPTGRIVPRIC